MTMNWRAIISTTSKRGAKRLWSLMQRIPDLSVEIRDVIAQENTVVVRGVWSGTEVHTGRKLEFHGFVQWRFRDGKLAERWASVTPLAEVSEMSSDGDLASSGNGNGQSWVGKMVHKGSEFAGQQLKEKLTRSDPK